MTDETIMEAVKNGDLQKAALLFDRYNGRLYNFLARMVLSREVAGDLTQNVFLRLLKYRNSYKVGAPFQPWIFQMARNVFMDYVQKEKSKSAFVNIETMPDRIEDKGVDVDEQERLLQLSMKKLSDDQRELLLLTRFERMKYEDVAVMMNTSVANIKVRVHRAILKLREHYFELEKA